jgi:hypothetical protein
LSRSALRSAIPLLFVGGLVVLLFLRGGPSLTPTPGRTVPRDARRSSEAAPRAGLPDEVASLDLVKGRGEIPGGEKVRRDIFRFYDAPTPTPTPVPPTPTPLPASGTRSFIGPVKPPPPPTPTPIIPPAIPYKAIGLFGPREKPIVAFEEGGRLIGAREGDVLDGRFIVKKINRESVDFAFVGLPPEITRRLPLAQ